MDRGDRTSNGDIIPDLTSCLKGLPLNRVTYCCWLGYSGLTLGFPARDQCLVPRLSAVLGEKPCKFTLDEALEDSMLNRSIPPEISVAAGILFLVLGLDEICQNGLEFLGGGPAISNVACLVEDEQRG